MRASLPSRGFLLLLVLSLACSFSAFFTGYRQDLARFSALGQVAWAHLAYAEELKDDMGVIDWSRNLEKQDAVGAFQVILRSKRVAEGGNRNLLPAQAVPGVAYLFPFDWSFQRTQFQGSASPLEFILVFQTWPGPFLWGLFAFFISWILGYATALTVLSGPALASLKIQAPQGPPPSAPLPARPLVPSPVLDDQKGARLFIDKNYVIQQASPEAEDFFQKKAGEILGQHLLDLRPDPVLVQAIEKGVETKILKPFPAVPDLSATLKPQAGGSLLVLERTKVPSKSLDFVDFSE